MKNMKEEWHDNGHKPDKNLQHQLYGNGFRQVEIPVSPSNLEKQLDVHPVGHVSSTFFRLVVFLLTVDSSYRHLLPCLGLNTIRPTECHIINDWKLVHCVLKKCWFGGGEGGKLSPHLAHIYECIYTAVL